MDETAKHSVFLRIQVSESSQTKGLEQGWKRRARLGRDAKNTDGRFGINYNQITCFNPATGNSYWLNLDASCNKLSSYVYNKSFAMFPTMMISQGAKNFTFAGEVRGCVWVISEKNILHTDLREKIFLQGNTWRKNILHWKKFLSRPIILQCYMFGKKIPSPEIWGKKSLPTGG